jgi:Fe-S-cluster containining protein
VEISKFFCIKCGNCCEHLVGQLEKNIIKELAKDIPFFLGKGPVIMLAKPTLLLHDWEKELFNEKDVSPCHVVYDLKNKSTIALSYTLNKESCPLLNEDRECSIYSKRPIHCRFYPSPYGCFDNIKDEKLHSSHGNCKGEIPFMELHQMLGFKIINDDNFECNTKEVRFNLYKR